MSLNPRHLSESTEHFTPARIVEAARATMGTIDLDPASCAKANEYIRADHFFTVHDNGIRLPWCGHIFLNPPGGRSDNQERQVLPKCSETGACGLPVGHKHEGVESSQKKWWFKLAREFAETRVTSAIFVCFSIELLQTTQNSPPKGLPIPLDFPICFPKTRIDYLKEIPDGSLLKGGAPPHASAIIYLSRGKGLNAFIENFSPIGRIVG